MIMQPDSVYIKVSWRPIFKKMRYCLIFFIAKKKKTMIHAMIYDLLFICAHMIRMPCDGCTCVYILHGSFNQNLQAVCVIVREHRLHLWLEESN